MILGHLATIAEINNNARSKDGKEKSETCSEEMHLTRGSLMVRTSWRMKRLTLLSLWMSWKQLYPHVQHLLLPHRAQSMAKVHTRHLVGPSRREDEVPSTACSTVNPNTPGGEQLGTSQVKDKLHLLAWSTSWFTCSTLNAIATHVIYSSSSSTGSCTAMPSCIGERFCVPYMRKPPNKPSQNLLGTRQGS